jgi:hypothetical protein
VLLWRSCLRQDMVGQLPAMWPLLVNWPHMGQRKVRLWVRRRVLCTPHMNSCLWVNWVWVSEVFFVECEVGAVLRGAGEECSVFGGVSEGCVCVFGAVRVCVCFEVGISIGYGLP